MLTNKELTYPRYKVISTWPSMESNGFSLNMILVLNEVTEDGKHFIKQGIVSTYEQFFKDYNTIFKRLNWWEERNTDELPQYVRYWERLKNHYVHRVDKITFAEFYNEDYSDFQPADFNDYKAYCQRENDTIKAL